MHLLYILVNLLNVYRSSNSTAHYNSVWAQLWKVRCTIHSPYTSAIVSPSLLPVIQQIWTTGRKRRWVSTDWINLGGVSESTQGIYRWWEHWLTYEDGVWWGLLHAVTNLISCCSEYKPRGGGGGVGGGGGDWGVQWWRLII